MIVLADRYAYTAFARDVARGVDRRWCGTCTASPYGPILALYFRVPIDVSLDRLMARRVKLKFYEAGMDMGWSQNLVDSFRIFQGKVLDEYDRLVDEFGLSVIDASLAITDQQQLVRNLVSRQLEKPARRAGGDGLPGREWSGERRAESREQRKRSHGRRAVRKRRQRTYSGGPLLRSWLALFSRSSTIRERSSQSRGTTAWGAARRFSCCANGSKCRVMAWWKTGWTRSALMQPTIELAKSSNTLNKLTFVLLYGHGLRRSPGEGDHPRAKAGFVVLGRSVHLLSARTVAVRGVDRAWLRSLYGFAIAPHLVFYLKTDVDTLIRRVLSARGMDFWESGNGPEGR